MTNEQCLTKMELDMRLKNFTGNTREDYTRYVIRFLNFTQKPAMEITYGDIRKYIFHMMDIEKKKASTINTYTAAIRFFFEYTLGYLWDSRKVPKMKLDRHLPVILTMEQVYTLIESFENYKHKAIVSTMYSSGMRVSEVCHLRYEDISRSKRMIHVPVSKNRQDRYAILSDYNLEILTEYWFRFNRPRGWLFPSTIRNEPLTNETVERFVKKQVKLLGLPEGVTPHTMRHCFACHMMEEGVSKEYIQQLLGHRSPRSTDTYLQMTSKALLGLKSPLDIYREGLHDDKE